MPSSLPGVRRTRAGVLVALLWLVPGLGLASGAGGLAGPALAASAPPPPPAGATTVVIPPPKAYIVVDANTGAVVAASGDREARGPASLTKVLTALAASATLPHDGTLTISARAEAQPANKVGAKAGERWPIEDAMHVMLLQSANDLALAFAEAAGGTAEGFQGVLERTAASIGMQDPQAWRDPAGLDDEDSIGGGNLVSARDLAIAGRAMIADPWLSPIAAKPRYRFTAPSGVVHDAQNHNKLVLGRYPGALGGKTGYTKRSGNSLLASAQRDGRTMVAVVMDTRDSYGFASQLLDRGFATPVKDQARLERLPPLRLPTAANIKSPAPPPTAPQSTLEPPVQAADSPPASLDQPSEASPAPNELDRVARTDEEDRLGLPVTAAGAAVVLAAVVAVGRSGARRRRLQRYYKVPTRRPAP